MTIKFAKLNFSILCLMAICSITALACSCVIKNSIRKNRAGRELKHLDEMGAYISVIGDWPSITIPYHSKSEKVQIPLVVRVFNNDQAIALANLLRDCRSIWYVHVAGKEINVENVVNVVVVGKELKSVFFEDPGTMYSVERILQDRYGERFAHVFFELE